MKVAILLRRVQLAGGSTVAFPVGAFGTKDLAQKAAEEQSAMLGTMLRMGKVCKITQRPDGSMQLEPMGPSVAELLTMMGIQGFDMQCQEREVVESEIVVPDKPRLIIPK